MVTFQYEEVNNEIMFIWTAASSSIVPFPFGSSMCKTHSQYTFFHPDFQYNKMFISACSVEFIEGTAGSDVSGQWRQQLLFLSVKAVVLQPSLRQLMKCYRMNYDPVFTLWTTTASWSVYLINPYPTAFPYGNGMILHFYQQQESSTTKTVHIVINKGLKTYV